MVQSLDLQNSYFKKIYDHIQDAIIVMNQERVILDMNPAAKRMTGWHTGEKVPYCSYCQKRKVKNGEERCYLIANEQVPYFLSHMPAYSNQDKEFEMSTALMFEDKDSHEQHYLLVLRDQTAKKREEEARLSKMMIHKLIEAREEEHKRLAKELHDGVGQSLYSISIALQALEQHVHNHELLQYVTEVREQLEKTMTDIKSYSYQLRPKSLDQLGLVPTLETLVRSIAEKNADIRILLETKIKARLPAHIEINVYRVIQEAMHNMMKYAKATEARIGVFQNNDHIRLFICDNGTGFDVRGVQQGLGLKHMEERIHLLNGQFRIVSKRNKGTTLIANIPYKEEAYD
ncbi:MAG: histidine kinase [Ectobacillus sp.]